MSIVRAIYAKGVFRPIENVELPENSEVEFEPRVLNAAPKPVHEFDDIYEVLNERYSSGQHDTAERHNEHQP